MEDDRIEKTWYIYTVGHDSDLRNGDIVTLVTTWRHLEGLMLSERVRERQTV